MAWLKNSIIFLETAVSGISKKFNDQEPNQKSWLHAFTYSPVYIITALHCFSSTHSLFFSYHLHYPKHSLCFDNSNRSNIRCRRSKFIGKTPRLLYFRISINSFFSPILFFFD
ncbi:hypothetical protein HanRHA438_Chr10g0444411 [Helianthus annuus]|nr:hypothetical protein HanHA300_Chr10g0355251 [Helianthus annuus]KAJ0521010.1 hypothetical protein HanIR_Chr10g0465911 [Helianthus annuus]KAJ0529352.1 hypothetical protein HanHA89_Chr10g0376861 [Helianthus annuus]KAJ0878836.1 hypothetical protein HanRHA438_Chr10g0444411 [Helianthus annuus]